MPNKSQYILYHTEGCHLCELALEIVQRAQINFVQVDICDSEALAEKYGITIPVLSDGNQELNWPFDDAKLAHFLGV